MDPNITCAGSVLLAGWSVIDTLLVSAAAIAVKCMRWASLPWAENCVRESKLVVRSEFISRRLRLSLRSSRPYAPRTLSSTSLRPILIPLHAFASISSNRPSLSGVCSNCSQNSSFSFVLGSVFIGAYSTTKLATSDSPVNSYQVRIMRKS